MRGSPFSFSDFSQGLNCIDSPYTLRQGEARDLLNVVSSPRGAVKKRFGSVVFASGVSASFPTLGVTDSMKRAPENPLSNGGKWEVIEAVEGAGLHKARVVNEEAASESAENVKSSMVWNTSKSNPACSVLVSTESSETGSTVGLVACYKAAESGSMYTATWMKTLGHWKLEIGKKLKGTWSSLAEFTDVAEPKGREIGLTVAAGVVKCWNRVVGEAWAVSGEVADTSLTEGFQGFTVGHSKVGGASGESRIQNFSVGEMSAAPPTTEFNTIAAVNISGVNYLIAVSKKKIYSIAEDGTLTDITDGAAVTEGLRWSVVQSTAGSPNRVTADGPIYLSNGVDPPRYWTGATKATVVAEWTSKPEGEFVAVPKAKYLTYFGNRVWASGISTDTSAVRFSGFAVKTGEGEQADPTNWPKENVVWFEKEDGEPITGTGIAGSNLMVFKAHKTWAVYDVNEGENRRLSDSVGCVSYRSIVETPQGTFFLTPDQGVFVTNGSTLREVSRNVRPILQGTDPTLSRAAKQDQLQYAAAEFLSGHYYLSYMAKDETWKTLDYDTVLQSWWLHDLAGLQWVRWEPKAGNSSLYTIPAAKNSGVVKAFVPGTYMDSGAVYTGAKSLSCYWVGPWEPFWQYFQRHRFNQPNPKKRVRELFVDGKGQLVTFVYKQFGGTSETLLGTVDNADMATPVSPVTLGTTEREYQAARYWSLGASRVWSFGFGNSTGEPLEIDSFSVHLFFRKS